MLNQPDNDLHFQAENRQDFTPAVIYPETNLDPADYFVVSSSLLPGWESVIGQLSGEFSVPVEWPLSKDPFLPENQLVPDPVLPDVTIEIGDQGVENESEKYLPQTHTTPSFEVGSYAG